jgi:hypothetical protein
MKLLLVLDKHYLCIKKGTTLSDNIIFITYEGQRQQG